MTTFAIETSWWMETILKSCLRARRGAAARRRHGLSLPVQDGLVHAEPSWARWKPGPYGSLQLLAEVGKSLQKEDIFPAKADRNVFAMAPYVVLMSTFLLAVVVPFGPNAVFTDLDTGVFFALAV